MDLPDRVTTGANWLRDVASDVVSNDHAHQRVVLILLDDALTPMDPGVLKVSHAIAQAVIDELGPDDLAGVVYTSARRNGQELTTDRVRLMAAVERFVPIGPTRPPGRFSAGSTGGGGAPPGVRGLGGECPRRRCLTDALRNAAEVLSGWPGARKTLILVSAFTVDFSERTMDDMLLTDDLGRTFAAMQRANLNVYQFDPRGLEVGRSPGQQFGTIAENTGGWAVANTNAPWEAVAQVFRENSSYYLIGFRPSESSHDGRFQKVSVQVSRPGLDVRTRAGYYASRPDAESRSADRPIPTPIERALAGGLPTTDLPLTLNVVPVPVPGQDESAVAIIAGIETTQGAGGPSGTDEIEVVATAFTDTWREAATSTQRFEITWRGFERTVPRADLIVRMDLDPGRYEVRVAVHSAESRRTGSVFASVTVPDFGAARLGLGGVLIVRRAASELPPAASSTTPDSMPSPWPAALTAARVFDRSDIVSALLPIAQHGRRQLAPVQVTTTIVDAADNTAFRATAMLEAASFATARQVTFSFPLPLAWLSPGRYLLSFVAVAASDQARVELPFQVEEGP